MTVLFAISWLLNFVVISIIVALVDERMGNVIEKKQWLGFALAFLLPSVLEIASFLMNGKSFLETLFPGLEGIL